MAFETVPEELILAGKAVKQEIFTKMKNSLDDHESRVLATEGAIGRLSDIPFDVVGYLKPPLAMDGALTYRVSSSIRITACRLFVVIAGSSGDVEIDVKYKRGAGAWGSILSSPITIPYTAGNYAVDSGTLSFQDMIAGDLLRLDIASVQDGMLDFSVYLENESA